MRDFPRLRALCRELYESISKEERTRVMREFAGCLTLNAPEEIGVSPYDILMEERYKNDWPKHIPMPSKEDIKFLAELSKRDAGIEG